MEFEYNFHLRDRTVRVDRSAPGTCWGGWEIENPDKHFSTRVSEDREVYVDYNDEAERYDVVEYGRWGKDPQVRHSPGTVEYPPPGDVLWMAPRNWEPEFRMTNQPARPEEHLFLAFYVPETDVWVRVRAGYKQKPYWGQVMDVGKPEAEPIGSVGEAWKVRGLSDEKSPETTSTSLWRELLEHYRIGKYPVERPVVADVIWDIGTRWAEVEERIESRINEFPIRGSVDSGRVDPADDLQFVYRLRENLYDFDELFNDIDGSWLLEEAMEALQEAELLPRRKRVKIRIEDDSDSFGAEYWSEALSERGVGDTAVGDWVAVAQGGATISERAEERDVVEQQIKTSINEVRTKTLRPLRPKEVERGEPVY